MKFFNCFKKSKWCFSKRHCWKKLWWSCLSLSSVSLKAKRRKKKKIDNIKKFVFLIDTCFVWKFVYERRLYSLIFISLRFIKRTPFSLHFNSHFHFSFEFMFSFIIYFKDGVYECRYINVNCMCLLIMLHICQSFEGSWNNFFIFFCLHSAKENFLSYTNNLSSLMNPLVKIT